LWLSRRKVGPSADASRSVLKRERMGDSPEKLAERHEPKGGVIDRMLRLGGVERENRFK
jgi:hypothetical protein